MKDVADRTIPPDTMSSLVSIGTQAPESYAGSRQAYRTLLFMSRTTFTPHEAPPQATFSQHISFPYMLLTRLAHIVTTY